MQNNMKLPLLPNRVFTEQINVKVDVETKSDVHLLKSHGIDTAELFREALRATIQRAKSAVRAG